MVEDVEVTPRPRGQLQSGKTNPPELDALKTTLESRRAGVIRKPTLHPHRGFCSRFLGLQEFISGYGVSVQDGLDDSRGIGDVKKYDPSMIPLGLHPTEDLDML